MSTLPARDELHGIIDRLDEPMVERVLSLVKSEFSQRAAPRPWPESLGAGKGPADLAESADTYLSEGFGG